MEFHYLQSFAKLFENKKPLPWGELQPAADLKWKQHKPLQPGCTGTGEDDILSLSPNSTHEDSWLDLLKYWLSMKRVNSSHRLHWLRPDLSLWVSDSKKSHGSNLTHYFFFFFAKGLDSWNDSRLMLKLLKISTSQLATSICNDSCWVIGSQGR